MKWTLEEAEKQLPSIINATSLEPQLIYTQIAKCSGELRGFLRTQGQPRSQADIFIAATAKIHSLTLVTRNIKDFEGCGISTLNPFS